MGSLKSLYNILIFDLISIFLKIEGKGVFTAMGYKFICPIFRQDKTSLYQGLEKLSENRINGYRI